jgi:Ca2+-dependent lipid-binding protein
MRLCVHVLEARGLPAAYLTGHSDPYVRLQMGRRRAKTTVVKRCLSPLWDEEFGFAVGDAEEELVVSVLNEEGYFGGGFLGRVKVPLSTVMAADGLSLGTAWYHLHSKGGRFRKKRRGTLP